MRKLLIICVILIASMGMFTGCIEDTVEEKGQAEQAALMERARKQVPTPNVNNFQTRKTVAKWMKRMDQPQKEFYCYLMASNGQIVHYFVSQGRPVSVGSFLTPPQKEYDLYNNNQLGPAPALDGVYYGSGGSSGTARFTFDAATDCYFEVVGVGNYIMLITDQPLDIDAPELTVNIKKQE